MLTSSSFRCRYSSSWKYMTEPAKEQWRDLTAPPSPAGTLLSSRLMKKASLQRCDLGYTRMPNDNR